jgi:folate-binding protein YgfZ
VARSEFREDKDLMSSFVDVSGRVVLRLSGSDSLDFIQRISTNDVATLQLGQSKQTVLTSEKGRIIDVVALYREDVSRLLLLGQSEESAQLISWIEKYIIMDDIHIEELTSSLSQYLLYGDDVANQVQSTSFSSHDIIAISEDFGTSRLVRVVSPRELMDSAEKTLGAWGVARCSMKEFEEFRIRNGIPGAGAELTPQYNPLEANLGSFISWTKGCYIGQEVIARLDTYKKVQRRLVTLSMSDLPENLPIPFQDEEGEAGVITSATKIASTGEIRGIGYLKASGSDHPKAYFFMKDGRKIPLQVCAVPS